MSGPAVGNQDRQDLGGDLAQNFNVILCIAQVLATVVELPLRAIGSFGPHYCRCRKLAGVFIPALVSGLKPPEMSRWGEPSGDPVCVLATVVLLALYILHAVASRRNRGLHSKDIGRTWGAPRVEPAGEFLVGLLAGGALLLFVSETLGGLVLAAAVANAIQLGAMTMKRRLNAVNANDAMLEGMQFGDDLRERQG